MNAKERTAIIEYAAQDVVKLSAQAYNLGKRYDRRIAVDMAQRAKLLVLRLEGLLREEVSDGGTE